MSGYVPITGAGAGAGAVPKAVSRRDAGRIELTAVSGMRFFATFSLVCGRAIENLWIDEGTDGKLFNQTICSGLHTLAKDVVSFYYILSGFTMCWGYLSRDFNTDEVRWRYWTRRFARFYPDFFLSTVVTFLLKLPYFFGCHDYGWPSWLSNASSLLLFTAWYRFIPGTGYINGPVWFIVTLFWLWVFFPYLLKPVKMVFANCGWADFMAKLALVWVISLLPWSIIDEENLEALRWGLRCFPILRIPEFVIGMAIALRVNKDKEEMDDEERSDAPPPAFRPRMLAGVGPIICVTLAGSYYLWKVMIWPDDCECLPGDRSCPNCLPSSLSSSLPLSRALSPFPSLPLSLSPRSPARSLSPALLLSRPPALLPSPSPSLSLSLPHSLTPYPLTSALPPSLLLSLSLSHVRDRRARAHARACMHARTHTHTRAHTHTHAHTHPRTHTHASTQTQTQTQIHARTRAHTDSLTRAFYHASAVASASTTVLVGGKSLIPSLRPLLP